MKKSTKIVIIAIAVLLISIFLILYLQIIVNTMYGIDHTSQILDLQMEVSGMKPVYDVGEPITFSVHVKTLGTFVPWPDFRIYKDRYVDNTSEPVLSRNYMTPFEPEDKFNLTDWREQTWDFPLETDTGNPMVPGNDDGIIQFFEEGTYVLRVNAWGKQEKIIEFEIRDLSHVIIPQGTMVEGNENLIQIAKDGKYLKVISAHVPPDAFRKELNSAKKTGKQVSIIYAKNTMIPKGFKDEFTGKTVKELISNGTYERKMVDRVQVYVVLNDKTALVLFPDTKGNVDLNVGFVSNESAFHEWCLDYHQYLWERAGRCDVSKFRES